MMGLKCDYCLMIVSDAVKDILRGKAEFERYKRETDIMFRMKGCISGWTWRRIMSSIEEWERTRTEEARNRCIEGFLNSLRDIGMFCQNEGIEMQKAREKMMRELEEETY